MKQKVIYNNCRCSISKLSCKVEQLGGMLQTEYWVNPSSYRVYSPHGISPTLNTSQGGGRIPFVLLEIDI